MTARLAFALAASFAVSVSAQQAPTQQQEQPYRPGPGIENPAPIRSVQPKYTRDAMTNRIEGVVEIEAVVMPDGTIGQVQVVKSLDAIHGLDNEAMAAAKQWRFRPGVLKNDGRAVPAAIPGIAQISSRALSARTYTDIPYKVCTSPRRVRFHTTRPR